MRIVNVTKNQVLSDNCRFANSFLKRLLGLLGRNSLKPGEGLLIDNCHGIHTIGMRFKIDVLFLDKDLRVMRMASNVRPFSLGPVVNNAIYVLELPAGMLQRTHTETGDQIQFRTGSEAAHGTDVDEEPASFPTLSRHSHN